MPADIRDIFLGMEIFGGTPAEWGAYHAPSL